MLPSDHDAIRRFKDFGIFSGWLQITIPALLATLLFSTPLYSQAEKQAVSEYQVKAAFLYNFSRFTKWPDEAAVATADFHLCVVGNDPFGEALKTLAGKMVHGRPLIISRSVTGPLIEPCHMVFVSPSESARTPELLAELRNKPALTVSDAEGFIAQGGMIQLKLADRKIRFEINIDAADRAELTISSKLLSLATIVHEKKTE